MHYTPQDQLAVLKLFCSTLDIWRRYGIRDANLADIGRHILIAQCEGKDINVHSIAECIGGPYETVRGRVNRLLESGLFCRTDNGTIQLSSDDESISKWTSASQQVIDNLLTVAAEINERHRNTEIR